MTVSVPLELEFSSNGDGVTTSFPYPVRFLDKEEIVVILRNADDVDTVQTLNTDYAIAGSSWPSGGNVVFSVAPVSGLKVVRYRQTQAKQVVDLDNKAKNNAESVEQQLDRLTMVAQDNERGIGDLFSKSVKFPRSYSGDTVIGSPDPGKILGWNADGTKIVNKEIVTPGAIVAGTAGIQVLLKDTTQEIRDYLDTPVYVPTRTELKALNTSKDKSAWLQENGRSGMFDWYAGTAPVSDPGEGYYIASDTSGYWRRRLSGAIDAMNYGVKGDGTTDDFLSFQRCVTYANGRNINISGLDIRIPTGNEILLPALGLNIEGQGRVTYEGTGNLFKGANITTTPFNFTATAAQTTFVCAYTYRGPYVEVFVGGNRVSHRTYTVTRDGTNVTIVFAAGQTLGAAVRVECSRIDVAGVLDGYATVRIGSGVEIVTTQVNQGRAFALGWNDNNFEKREDPRFIMEAGAVIKGADGTKGFKNAVWLNAVQGARVFGEIYGIGANNPSATAADFTTCPYAFYMTGAFTPSDLKMVGGMIGFYDKCVAAIGDTFEGLSAYGWTFLKCGHAVYWLAPTTDQGLLLTMNGCHGHCMDGIILAENVSTVLIGDNDFFQGPDSTASQFIFVSIKGSERNSIHDNELITYKVGATAYGVVFDSAARLGRVHDNLFAAIDTTGSFVGTVCLSGSYDNVIGPNTYQNIDRALEARAGSQRIGAVTGGDVFQTPPGVLSRYEMVGSNGWIDQKWLAIGNASAQSIASSTISTWTYAETSDPESLYSGGTLTAPVWAKRARIKGTFNFAANGTGVRLVRVVRNGSSTPIVCQVVPNAIDNGAEILFDQEFAINGGDTFVFHIYQNSGGALNLNASNASVLFS